MSSNAQIGGDGTGNPLDGVETKWYETLRHPRRIRILEVLRTNASPTTLTELTAELVDRESAGVSDDRTQDSVQISLVHNHLPRLAECGFLEWDGETASLADSSPFQLSDLSALLDACDPENETRLLEVLVHPVRIRLYSILQDREQSVSLEELAYELTARETGSDSDTTPEDARISLYHAHLPAMDDVGLLEFDRDSRMVRGSDQRVHSLTH